jgi:CDP-glucose 4,6-dehydratase
LTQSTFADVRDLAAVREALERSEAEVVIHMAAQPLVRYSYDDPVGTYATNVMGTVNVLEAVRLQESVKATVVVTSDKCYENQEWVWGYRENEPMGGYDPYSNSKGCSELVVSAYRRSFMSNLGAAKLASGRAGNVIGGGDWSRDRLVPDLISAFSRGIESEIRNPDAVRPWQHVLDPLLGYVKLAAALMSPDGARYAEGWNFGPDAEAERTVLDVTECASRVWGAEARWRRDVGNHAHEAGYLKLDSSKARRMLHWRPVLDFETAITYTVEWYRAELSQKDMRAFTHDQIEKYLVASSR